MEHGRELSTGWEMAALVHDLRTPMCAAAGAAQMALEAGGRDVSVQLHQILQAVGAMDRMLAMIGDERDGSSIFTGDMLYKELQAVSLGRAQVKAQHLSIDLSALEGIMLEADYGALCRLLSNLLGNAIKYTPAGGEITLRAQLLTLPWRSGAVWLRFIVADNGMGMKRAFMRRMYMPRARAEESASLPGKGLGLTIVRKLTRQMGGTIRVKSEWQKGTVFTITVPATQRKSLA